MSSRVPLLITLTAFVLVTVPAAGATGAAATVGAAPADRFGRPDRIPDDLMPVLQQTMQRDALTTPTTPVTLLPGSPTGAAQMFGTSVAIDGDTAIVGAPRADIGNGADQGAAYVFVRQGGVWTQQARLENGAVGSHFGTSVALAGNVALVGAPSQVVALIPFFTVCGAAFAYERTGTTWTSRGMLVPNDCATDDGAGSSVATDGTVFLIGAPNKDGGNGAVYRFFMSTLGGISGPFKLTASDGVSGDAFGGAVAVHGKTAIIGAPFAVVGGHADQGAAYVFEANPLTPDLFWDERAKLTASDGAELDRFGSSVALQGDLALIGAPGAAGAGRPGAAYFFRRSGATWTQQKLTPSDSAADDLFGWSVALSGDQAAVGALTGPTNGVDGASKAYFFQQTGGGWQQRYELRPPANTPDLRFGSAVAVGLQTVLVGAPNVPQHGAAYVFGSSPPTISAITDVITIENATASVSFSVGDAESDPGELPVSAVSSDGALLPQSGLTFGGSSAQRTLAITPAADRNGAAFVTVTVRDGFSTSDHTFRVQVLPLNSAPVIAPIADHTTFIDTPLVIPFTIGDVDNPLDQLLLFVTSSNTTVLPSDNIIIGPDPLGSAASRTLTITPAAHEVGTTTIILFATDGAAIAIRRFVLTVDQHPPATYYLAEGSTGAFFDTDLLLANPNDIAAPITITFFKENGTSVVQTRTLDPLSRTTIRVDDITGMEATAFSTSVTSTQGLPIVVERTMRWDASGYGAHGEKAVDGAALQWYFAEGSQGFFSTFFLLVNPGTTANTAHVTYLREFEPSITRDYALKPTSRYTVDAAKEPDLINRSFGAIITFDQPGVAERAMYFGRNLLWTGGHDSVGVTAPSTSWFLAEGATGTFFNTFVLLANPNTESATATVTYLPATGAPITRDYQIAGRQRLTINIATEDPALASAAVSTRVESTRPIIVERSQYWPAPDWYEAHNSFGVTATGTHWGLAEGRVGGANAYQTFILLANPGTDPADVTVRFLRTSGAPLVKTFTVPPTRRFNISITGDAGSMVPELADEAFGAAIESTQPIAVERAMYSDATGVVWAAGTSATATRLP
jgi:hypothetical protein